MPLTIDSYMSIKRYLLMNRRENDLTWPTQRSGMVPSFWRNYCIKPSRTRGDFLAKLTTCDVAYFDVFFAGRVSCISGVLRATTSLTFPNRITVIQLVEPRDTLPCVIYVVRRYGHIKPFVCVEKGQHC